MDKLHFKDSASIKVINNKANNDCFNWQGIFKFKCINPDGSVAWEDTAENLGTTQGKNYILDNALAGAAFTATYYFGLISSVGYSALAAGDTAAQINGTNGWKEAATAYDPDYSEVVRQTANWGAGASGGVKTTSSVSSFTISTNGTLKGAFMSTSSVKDGTAGSLICEVLFTGGDQVVTIGQVVQISYSLQL